MQSTSTRPLAIGLVYHGTHLPPPVERRQVLVDLTRHAHREGLALLETFEFTGPRRDDSVGDAVTELVSRAEASALVVAGPRDWSVLRAVAERTELPLHFLREGTPMREIRDRQGWTLLTPRVAGLY